MLANQIKKIKFKKGYYELTINGNIYQLDEFYYEDLLAYEGKILEVGKMIELIAFATAYKALKKLYKKIFNHSICTYDVKFELRKNNISEEHIKLIINKLKQDSYLNEDDFIAHYKEIYEAKKGTNAFKKFLESKYISSNKIQIVLQEFNENEEIALNYAKSFIKGKVCSTKVLKMKLFASLSNKGFSKQTINNVIDCISFDNEEESLSKEIKKSIKKYNNDYYKILNKLIAKGYNSTNIKTILKKEGVQYEN